MVTTGPAARNRDGCRVRDAVAVLRPQGTIVILVGFARTLVWKKTHGKTNQCKTTEKQSNRNFTNTSEFNSMLSLEIRACKDVLTCNSPY